MNIKKASVLALICLVAFVGIYFTNSKTNPTMNVYDFNVKDVAGQEVSLAKYSGKILLIVNTATECGFTPQYKDLQDLYLKYKNEGFEILDFPCNQFGKQAPGSNEELAQFCEKKYNTTFKTFGKINVNGDSADPLFKYLKENSNGLIVDTIKWNFTKFLIDNKGYVFKRYAPHVNPSKIAKDIEKLINQSNQDI